MKNESIRKVINVDKLNYPLIWTFKQEDDAVLNLSLVKNSVPLSLVGQTIKLGVLRADKTLVELEDQSCFRINNNELAITLKNNILSVPGKAECDLTLIDASGKMTTASFFIEVQKKTTGIVNILGTNILEGLEKLKNDFKSTGDKLISAFSKEYESLKRIMIDENQAANLQDQVNQTNAHLETIAKITTDNLQNDINNNSTIYIDKDISINREIIIPSNRNIKFRNGAKIIATITGEENVFKILGDNVKIYYPNIEYTANSSSPHAGYGNALVVGNYRSDNIEKYHNIKIISPNFTRKDNSGSIISIFNDCHNIRIDEPILNGGALGILLHWSGDFDESQPHTSPSTVTWHPHNIKINNYKYVGIGKAIHLASCYDVTVEEIEAINSSLIVEIGCGDYANSISEPRQKHLVGKGIKIKNVYGYNIKNNAITIGGKGTRGGDISQVNILPKYDINVENVLCEKGESTNIGAVAVVCNNETKGVNLKNINCYGYTNSSTIFLQDCSNINIDKCIFDENNHNITLVNVKNIVINGCELDAITNPINFSNASANKKCECIEIKNCVFNKANNPIYLYNAKDVTIDKCEFNDYKSNNIKFGGVNKNVTLKNCVFNKGTTNGISSNVEVGLVEVFNCYDNVFNAMEEVIKFNINVLTTAFKCNIHDNVSYGATTPNSMMIYQGTRSDRSNVIYNNQTFNEFNVGIFTNYYSIDLIEK